MASQIIVGAALVIGGPVIGIIAGTIYGLTKSDFDNEPAKNLMDVSKKGLTGAAIGSAVAVGTISAFVTGAVIYVKYIKEEEPTIQIQPTKN